MGTVARAAGGTGALDGLGGLSARFGAFVDLRLRPSRFLLIFVAVAGVAAAAGSVALALTSDHVGEPETSAALIDWVTLPYILAGLVAWWRRPESRFGVLMIAAGFANCATTLSWANASVPQTFGQAIDLIAPVLFVHVFLAYPSGHLQSRLERLIVGAGYATAIGFEVVRMSLGEFGSKNLLEIAYNPHAADVLRHVQLLLVSAFALAGLAVLVHRWREATPALRRVLAPVIGPGAIVCVMIAVLLTSAAFSGPEVVAMHRVTFAIIGLAPFFFLFGLLRPRFAVGPLLLALREARGSDERRNALAAALGDPSLDVLYSLPETNEYATSSGQVVELPAPDDERAVTHVQSEGHPVGALVHDGSLRSEPELVRNVAAAATFALENERLQAELQASLRQVAESRARIVRASDDERRRLERNLHDGAQQQLLSLSVTLSLLESRAAADPATRDLMRTAREQLAESLEGLRELARGIHPAVLSDHGLAVALETVAARTPLPVLLSVETERLPPPVEVAVYYLVCETLANVARHSRATQAEVLIARRGDWAAADVADNGVGGADPSSGSGLRGLADRIEALGGSLSIESPPGSGTRIAARIPC